MYILKKSEVVEIYVKNSRFIAELFFATTNEQCRTLIKEQKKRYADARHVVHAFILGKKAEIFGLSDDGEPAGTAGRPILEVLKGSQCIDCLLTVTRYFGGTLLGTGGLVKAYTEAAQKVIHHAEFELYIERTEFTLTIEYSEYELLKRFLLELGCTDIREHFLQTITVTGYIAKKDTDQLQTYVRNITRNKTIVMYKKNER